MTLYVVLRHPGNPEQAWINEWQPDGRLVDSIMTNKKVSTLCQTALLAGESVYVHRCAWGAAVAEITSSAKVKSVTSVDRDFWVQFSSPEPIAAQPHVQPFHGQNEYIEATPLGC